MARKRNPLALWLIRVTTIGFGALTGALPLPWARTLGRGLGRIAYYAVPRIRRVGLANLDLAYGDTLSDAEKRRILRGAVENVALVAAEFSHVPPCARTRFQGLVTFEGLEHINREKGCLCIGAHLGNWEWLAPVVASIDLNVAEVVRPFDDPTLDRMIDGMRKSAGATTIPKDEAGSEMLRLLQEEWVVGVLIDQSPRNNGIPVTFFGAPCWATIAPAMIALRSKKPIHPVSLFRNPDDTYTFRFYPALDVAGTEDMLDYMARITQECQDVLETMIREHPEQWLWFHRRWKKRPRLEQEWAERTEARAAKQARKE